MANPPPTAWSPKRNRGKNRKAKTDYWGGGEDYKSRERESRGIIFDAIEKGNSFENIFIKDACEKLFAGGDVPAEYSKEKNDEFRFPIYANGLDKKGLYGYAKEPKVTEPALTISARGTIGYCEARKEPFVPIVRLIVAILKKDLFDLDFMKYFLDSLNIISNGSSIQQLTVPMISEIKIPHPPLETQRQIVEKLDKQMQALEGVRLLKEEAQKRIEEILAGVWGE